ncbi:HD domain-containing protein [Roseibium sp. Sym1]|uniref:HD domain-containing protein n=1 Tax=Roseibium sp. Sym1 TaxID=3016006 RepID=UPI0022B48138|nr:HD domain-containing protein [Roseibium sp. Sym1]
MADVQADMGTVAWGRRQGAYADGRLTRVEKLKLVLNLGRMTALEAMDGLKVRTGLMNAFGTDLDGMQPPDTALVRDALDFADDVQSTELMRHSWRTYYWAVALGEYKKLPADRELLFSAAILHDVGLAGGRTREPGDCCFVVHGAERCKRHLVGKGHDRAKIRKIADAIGLHLNGYVSERLHGAEAHLLSRGAMCDVFGMGRMRISPALRNEVSTTYPRGDLVNALEIWPGHHLEGTRADVLIKLGGKRGKKERAMQSSPPENASKRLRA